MIFFVHTIYLILFNLYAMLKFLIIFFLEFRKFIGSNNRGIIMRLYTFVLSSFTQVHRRVPILKEDLRKNLKLFILFMLTLYLDQDLASETVGISYNNLYDLNLLNVVTSWHFCFIFENIASMIHTHLDTCSQYFKLGSSYF